MKKKSELDKISTLIKNGHISTIDELQSIMRVELDKEDTIEDQINRHNVRSYISQITTNEYCTSTMCGVGIPESEPKYVIEPIHFGIEDEIEKLDAQFKEWDKNVKEGKK